MEKLLITIPTGQRAKKALETVKQWREQDVRTIVYVWDDETYKLLDGVAFDIIRGERQSFPILQNLMFRYIMKRQLKWVACICGADDLWPDKNIALLEKAAELYPKKVLWVYDGLNPYIATHPVITKTWYVTYAHLFDEKYKHNCCDTDLMARTARRKQMIKVLNVQFLHRHPMKTPLAKRDAIYRLGYSSLLEDRARFNSKFNIGDFRKWRRQIKKVNIT